MQSKKHLACEECGGNSPKVNSREKPPRAVHRCADCGHMQERLVMW